jgi:hypothetical protein
MDQTLIGGVMIRLTKTSIGQNIYCMLCGRMTPQQRTILRKRSKVDTSLYIDLLTWFIQESGHPGFSGVSIPEECPQPFIIEDEATENNTDREINPTVETSFGGGNYLFSSANNPNQNTSVFKTERKFTIGLLNQSAPTLLVSGGTYATMKELLIESVLPFVFLYGIGGPKMN